MILYHIMADTGCLPDDVVPQIPTNRMKGEDQEIPRICLGHTLDDCLTSIGIAHFVSKFLLAELRQNKKYSKDMPLRFGFGQTAKPCRTRNFRIKSWISLRNGLTKPEKEAHQKLLHILANSIVLKLYDR